MTDLIVIGAGAVGLSVAYQAALRFPSLKIKVLEKEATVSAHQTGHNSGVIHSGLYYKPGSLKATLCVSGREELVAFAQANGVPHDVCGKIVVATRPEELPQLDAIFQRGLENGLPDIRFIGPQEITEIEPFCVGIKGIWVPYTGIVDFPATCRALAARLLVSNPRNQLLTNSAVTGLERKQGEYTVHTPAGPHRTRNVIACAGLQADRLAWADGLQPDMRIVGFRGDYYDLTPAAKHKVRNLIYPVPNPAFPFLGVHFTRMTDGTIECGPNAVFVFKREGYGKTDFNWRDTRQALGYGGTWALFRKHWRFGLDEYRRAFSKRLFCKRLNAMMPSLTMAEITPGRAGVRAQAVDANGNLIDDFRFAETDNAIHVLNAPSPAATACLAIGQHIVDRAANRFGWDN